MKWMVLAAFTFGLVGCDKAQKPYEDCVRSAETAAVEEAKGAARGELKAQLKSAHDSCEEATRLDANSAAGKAALAKLPELIRKLQDIEISEERARANQELERLRAEQERIRTGGQVRAPQPGCACAGDPLCSCL